MLCKLCSTFNPRIYTKHNLVNFIVIDGVTGGPACSYKLKNCHEIISVIQQFQSHGCPLKYSFFCLCRIGAVSAGGTHMGKKKAFAVWVIVGKLCYWLKFWSCKSECFYQHSVCLTYRYDKMVFLWKHCWCALDPNPGPQDGRHRRINWAMADPPVANIRNIVRS